ncbi:transporter substrate-binding domain-containing protein [Pseudosulfitobacter pseudonitzschiae]|uniref:transporter substrate-binding domain-containing protein n=1 Tax=Pseudosulfitobacter pseudonitzschiae TaxID=1402135 RepID=UPI001AF464E0|nr:transporter substrate-binding domain-containing protein [Pseudosulfitobacter pseudonitzschiae]MBM1814316.1 transporter substrate-binding domain-containing protein [Pseudosulfitobacter pseudonitzschiae]MBM1831309.1 transporter substrate-binding domain-containing protein [Pseudosulfitobacter pseudonitzschiae]MBM1836176.1 transporter substrate-binding domain-containing protein [Pseudosulfitobacter pseudonitzschiae]MBM1841022.1 transporter substrate-binding domain-containing protein [Pseudosulfi
MKFAYLIEPPFNYVDTNGDVTGCDVELARHVFQELGISDFEPVETEFAELLPGLVDGRWRMTTGLFGTDERRQSAQFTRPIWALPDGLLVGDGNPMGLTGYRSLASSRDARLAVIRDQFQHRSAVEFGVSDQQIVVFETYTEAAKAVRDGAVDAYASVGRAHSGFIEQHADWQLDLVLVSADEKPPAFGSFAVSWNDTGLLNDVDAVLSEFLGSDAHRQMVAAFGFSNAEVDLVTI